MNKNKKMGLLGVLGAVIILIAVIFGMTHQSLSNNLKQHKWNFVQQGQSFSTDFSDTKMTIHSPFSNDTMTYQTSKSGGKDYLIVDSYEVSNQKYEVTKTSDGYKVTADNKNAHKAQALDTFELVRKD